MKNFLIVFGMILLSLLVAPFLGLIVYRIIELGGGAYYKYFDKVVHWFSKD